MIRYSWLLASLTAVSACSEGRERHVAATNAAEQADLTLPDTVARRDTAAALPERDDQPVSPVEEMTRSDTAGSTVLSPPRPSRSQRKPRAKPVKPVEDTAVQAYAPNREIDSVPPVARSSPDNTPPTAATPDTGLVPDTSTPRVRMDSITNPGVDTAPSPEPAADTTGPSRRDTLALSSPDTVSTPTVDMMVDSAPAAREPATPLSSAAPAAARTLPTGTLIHAALVDSISSRRDTVGHQVRAHIMENVVGPDGKTLIAAGTPVRFTIIRLRPARSKNSQGRLALRADGIALNGQLKPLKAEVRPVPRELRGRGVTASEVAKVGGGAAAGAVLGRVIGGNTRGAVIGGVAGAAAGTVLATQTATRDVVVKAKTPVTLVLTEPLVTP
jgi:hypothetical protein